MSTKPTIHIPDDAEDAAITQGALSDPDNPPLTDAQLEQLRPAPRRGRPALPPEARKVTLNMRADRDVVEAFKATGDGWQTRINEILRAYAHTHRMLPR